VYPLSTELEVEVALHENEFTKELRVEIALYESELN